MLGTHKAHATVAVRDIAQARSFYEGVLGLAQVDNEGEDLVAYRAGDSVLLVYRSEYAGSNRATAVTWDVGERVDELVRTLKSRGVQFEHYPDMPGMTLEGDVHVGEGMRVAWFKDPDGNIHNLASG